jgi:hypothetical protein
MNVLRPRRLLPLLILFCVTADLMDPAVPGVFFFDNGAFFVDGVVQLKGRTATDLAPLEPMPKAGPAHCNGEIFATELRVVTQPLRLQDRHWKSLKHDASASFDSSSPSDSSAIPPLS